MTEEQKTLGQVAYYKWLGWEARELWDLPRQELWEAIAQVVVDEYRERAREALIGKSFGQVAYESVYPAGDWDWQMDSTRRWWQAIGSAVANAVREADGARERKGKRLAALEERVEKLERHRVTKFDVEIIPLSNRVVDLERKVRELGR